MNLKLLIAVLLMILAGLLLIDCELRGIHMTQGEKLANMLAEYCLAVALLLSAGFLTKDFVEVKCRKSRFLGR